MGLSRWLSGKESTYQCRRCMFNSGLGRSPGGGNGYPVQYSCLENPTDREVWRATVPGGCKELGTTSNWARTRFIPTPLLICTVLHNFGFHLLLLSSSVMSDSLQHQGLQHTRLPCPSPIPRACSNSSPLSQWCHPTISFSVTPFSSGTQPFPALGSFLMSWLFASGAQSIGVSASTSVPPINIHGWFPLELTGLISLLSKGLSKVFSNTTVQKHQFFRAQLSLYSTSHIHTWPLEKP